MLDEYDDLDIPIYVPAQEEPQFIDHFLNLIKARPCIYNNTLKEYHIPHIKENAMIDIANSLNEPVGVSEKRWKSLKAKFSVEKNLQEREGRSGSAASTRAQWPHYDAMRNMLVNVNLERRVFSNVQSKTPPAPKPNRSKKSVNKSDALVHNALSVVNHTLNDLVGATKSIIKKEEPASMDEETLVGHLLLNFLNRSSPTKARAATNMVSKILSDALFEDTHTLISHV